MTGNTKNSEEKMGDWPNVAAWKQAWSDPYHRNFFWLARSNNADTTTSLPFCSRVIPRLSLLLSHSLSPTHSHLEPTSTVTRSCVCRIHSLGVGDPTDRCSLIAIAVVVAFLLSRGCSGHVCSRMDFRRNS